MKKIILTCLFILIITVSVLAEPTFSLGYNSIQTEQQFSQGGAKVDKAFETSKDVRRISKLPQDVTQTMEREVAKL